MTRSRGSDAAKTEAHFLLVPDNSRAIEAMLRSGKLALGGFMGWDDREPHEVIAQDVQEVWAAGRSIAELSARMTKLTREGTAALGNPVVFDNLEIVVEENKGLNLCPWECPDIINKRVTTVSKPGSDKSLQWSDLGIHMLRKHGFFGGKGCAFRIEPRELIELIF